MRNRGMFALIAALGVIFFLAAPSQAQFPGMDPSMNPMGLMRDMQFGPLMLLSRSEVHKELKLSKNQSTALKNLQKEHMKLLNDQMKAGQGGDTAQMMEAMKQVQSTQTEFNNKSKAVLTDEQRTRFDEIRLQVMGMQALQDPELQTALGLTPEQKISLSALNIEYTKATMNSARNVYTAQSYKSKRESLENEYKGKLAKILTADQANLLMKKQGAPFKDVKKLTG